MRLKNIRRVGLLLVVIILFTTLSPLGVYASPLPSEIKQALEDILNKAPSIKPDVEVFNYDNVVQKQDSNWDATQPVTRRLFSERLVKGLDLRLSEKTVSFWNDVPQTEPYLVYLNTLRDNNIRLDNNLRLFKPEFIMTVGEVETVLKNYCSYLYQPIDDTALYRGVSSKQPYQTLRGSSANVGVVNTMIYNVAVHLGAEPYDEELFQYDYDFIREFLMFAQTNEDYLVYDLIAEQYSRIPKTTIAKSLESNHIKVLYKGNQIVDVLEKDTSKVQGFVQKVVNPYTIELVDGRRVDIIPNSSYTGAVGLNSVARAGALATLLENPYTNQYVGFYSQLDKAYYVTERNGNRLHTFDGEDILVSDWNGIISLHGDELTFKDIEGGMVVYVDKSSAMLYVENVRLVENHTLTDITRSKDKIEFKTNKAVISVPETSTMPSIMDVKDILKGLTVKVAYNSRKDAVYLELPVSETIGVARRFDEVTQQLELEEITATSNSEIKLLSIDKKFRFEGSKSTRYKDMFLSARNQVVRVVKLEPNGGVLYASKLGDRVLEGVWTSATTKNAVINKASYRATDALLDMSLLGFENRVTTYKEFYDTYGVYIKYLEPEVKVVLDGKDITYVISKASKYKDFKVDRNRIVYIRQYTRVGDDYIIELSQGDETHRVIIPYERYLQNILRDNSAVTVYGSNNVNKGFVELYDIFEIFWTKEVMQTNLDIFKDTSKLRTLATRYENLSMRNVLGEFNSTDTLYTIKVVEDSVTVSPSDYAKLEQGVAQYNKTAQDKLDKLKPFDDAIKQAEDSARGYEMQLVALKAELAVLEQNPDATQEEIDIKKAEIESCEEFLAFWELKLDEAKKAKQDEIDKQYNDSSNSKESGLPFDYIIKVDMGDLIVYSVY